MIYFNNAATTYVKPDEMKEAVIKALNTMGNAGRGAGASLDAARTIFDTRVRLANLFNADNPKDIAFTPNATFGLNTAVKGLIGKGDHVITTVLEHNSVLRPLYEMEERGAEVTFVGCDNLGNPLYDDFERAVKYNTKAIICTHASNLTGNIVDIKRVGNIAKRHGLLFIVDASQSAGILDIDVKEDNIDVLVFTGHKGLLGPQGTGGIYVRDGVDVKPLLSGGSGFDSFNHRHPCNMPEKLEAGTLNGHGIAGLNGSLRYLEKTGIKNIREKEQSLMWKFYTGIKDIPNVAVYGDFSSKNRAAIVSMNILGYDSSEVSDALSYEFGIITRAGAHCAPLMHEALGTKETGAVRFSFSHNNTEEEINTAVKAVLKLSKEE